MLQNPSLADKFECIGCDYPPVQDAEPEVQSETVREDQADAHSKAGAEDRQVRRIAPVSEEAMRAPGTGSGREGYGRRGSRRGRNGH